MKVVFRADASLQIGSGHVMRCLTLADALKNQGAECCFLCRAHSGHLFDHIRNKGYSVHVLPHDKITSCVEPESDQLVHFRWLGVTQREDAESCRKIIDELRPEWLIVDHYALDIRWEEALRPFFRYLFVIDDLADRSHCCDLLLDQNLGRKVSDYEDLVPEQCVVLAGPQYALLRPEFSALRSYSLKRREKQELRNILITMGGVDKPNVTCQVLEALKNFPQCKDNHVTVIMGAKAPWLDQVRAMAGSMLWPTDVLVNVSDMAQRMAECDLSIGAAGSTSWERCCLGVPTLLVVLANNQLGAAEALENAGAVRNLAAGDMMKSHLIQQLELLMADRGQLFNMVLRASSITCGDGCNLLVDRIINWPDMEIYCDF